MNIRNQKDLGIPEGNITIEYNGNILYTLVDMKFIPITDIKFNRTYYYRNDEMVLISINSKDIDQCVCKSITNENGVFNCVIVCRDTSYIRNGPYSYTSNLYQVNGIYVDDKLSGQQVINFGGHIYINVHKYGQRHGLQTVHTGSGIIYNDLYIYGKYIGRIFVKHDNISKFTVDINDTHIYVGGDGVIN